MLMTDGEIREALERGELGIEPYDENRLEPCSYDARLGCQALVSGDYKLVQVAEDRSVHLRAGEFALIMTEESFRVPLNMAGHIGTKSDLARRGLVLLAGLQVDPGFEGHLRLGVYNASCRPLTLDYLDPICMIEFHSLTKPAERPVGPFPDLRAGRIPEDEKAFLRELETTSLAGIQAELRTLSRNVEKLTTITYKVFLPIFTAIFAAAVIAFIFK